MKTFAVLALASVSALGQSDEAKQLQEDAMYTKLYGYKAFYDGYYRSFYKINSHETINEKCLDDTTIDNIVAMSDIIHDPFSLFNMKHVQEDINIMSESAEIMNDLSNCKFQQSVFDIMSMCKEKDEDGARKCDMAHMTENLSKNMFVLMGKMTGMAEMMKDYPAEDPDEYNMQMKELGTDAGTFLRVLYNFQTAEQAEEAAEHHSSARRHHN